MDEKYFVTRKCSHVTHIQSFRLFEDSVLCFASRIVKYTPSAKFWTKKMEWFTHFLADCEVDNIDGEHVRVRVEAFSQGTQR